MRTVHRLRKSFRFRNAMQAQAFLDIAAVYGKGRIFGHVVIFEASLEFLLWRKLENLACIVSATSIPDMNIHQMTSQAGLKAFRDGSQ